MIDANETKRNKAIALRYKKPIVEGLNLYDINSNLYDINDACGDVRWFFEGDDDTLINALDGDSDEAYEFKMMFADLSAECERLQEDLGQLMWSDEMKEAFNLWFPAVDGGKMCGWDAYESDYMPLQDSFEQDLAYKEAKKKIMRMTKEQILDSGKLSFKIIRSYLGLTGRFDQLKAAMDILRDQNTGYLQMVKQIEQLYEAANKDNFYSWYGSMKEFDRLIDCMPQEAWIQ